MTALPSFVTRVLGLVGLLVAALSAAEAQSPFTPVVRVDDAVITAWEVDQRERLLEVLRAPGDIREEALDGLIDERLQVRAAERLGVPVSEEEVTEAAETFAGRANLDLEQFLAVIGEAGVDPQSFRDFVRAGVAWRGAVRARFGPEAQVTPEDLEKARTEVRPSTQLRILLSEIILPAQNPERAARARALADEIGEIRSIDAFSAAAREYSAAPTREVGGRVDWLPIDQLPGPIAEAMLTLRPGEVAGPFPVPNAIALFQLRAVDEVEAPAAGPVTLDYAEFLIPGGRSAEALAEAQRLEARVDTCDDLYGVAQNLPEERLLREERPLAEVPQDVALQLARLDPGEVSTALTRGNALVFLMLCARDTGTLADVEDRALTNRIRGQRLTSLAEGWLAELRAEADIVRND